MKARRWAIVSMGVALPLVMGACGGGGSDGGGGGGGSAGGGDPSVPAAAIVMTNANARQVTTETIGGMAGPLIATGAVPTGSVVSTASDVATRNYLQVITNLGRALGMLASPATPAAAHDTEVTQCPNGGTITVVPADNTPTISMTFSNCNEAGSVLNGSVSLTNVSLPTNGVIADALMDLTLVESGVSERLRATLNLNATVSPSSVTVTMRGNRMFLERPGKTESLSNLNMTVFASDAGVVTLSGGFTYASTALNGSIRTDIVQTIRQDGSSDTPDSGIIHVSDSSGHVARATILGDENTPGNQIRLEIDVDGTPGFETTQFVQWSSIP